jgi:16S rRNA (uracil1498-N3)-methyltransferase
VVAAPWDERSIELSIVQWRHLTKVLRVKRGAEITYTDGLGTIGTGRLASQAVERGEETTVERPSTLTVAVAPPSNKDRQRFLVEKLAELGVQRLIWLETEHGTDRVANPAKVFSWVLAAVEQSRGAWLMETSDELAAITELQGRVVVCHPDGETEPGHADVLVVGPEGGFADGELTDDMLLWDLGPTVLRVETAAIVAASRIRVQ